MDYVCFFVSATGRRKMARVDEIEIREEEQGSIAKAFCAKDGAKQSKQIRLLS